MDWSVFRSSVLRSIGWNGEKDYFIRSLFERLGNQVNPTTSQDRPFEFDANSSNWMKLSQLEAVVEFYANFTDPWSDPQSKPQPGVNKPLFKGDPGYISIDFTDPSGNAAIADETPYGPDQSAGKVKLTADPKLEVFDIDLSLEGPDLTCVIGLHPPTTFGFWPHGDKRAKLDCDLFCLRPVGRPDCFYRIWHVDNKANKVIVVTDSKHPTPKLDRKPCPWTIRLRPFIIIIDGFGRRLEGNQAKQTTNEREIELDGNLTRINSKFDTIYLEGDKARPNRTYRITEFLKPNHVRLDAEPDLAGGTCKWYIPAGVGGKLPSKKDFPVKLLEIDEGYLKGRDKPRGWDNYDGALFVVKGGEVRDVFKWTSYTSRKNWEPDAEDLSSIRGNRKYFFYSYHSDSEAKYYCLGVTDPLEGSRNEGFQPAEYDGVSNARFYFGKNGGDHVSDDSTYDLVNKPPRDKFSDPPLGNDPPLGKTRVRIHHGLNAEPHHGTGSAGCLVSPQYADLRTLLIQLYEEDYHLLTSDVDPWIEKIERLAGKTQKEVKDLVTGDDWNWKITGTLWLIRPDELPLP